MLTVFQQTEMVLCLCWGQEMCFSMHQLHNMPLVQQLCREEESLLSTAVDSGMDSINIFLVANIV